MLAGLTVVIEKPYATRMDVSAFGAYADALAKHRISAHYISRLDDWSAYCVYVLARLSISRIWKSVKSALIFLCAFFSHVFVPLLLSCPHLTHVVCPAACLQTDAITKHST